MHSFFQARWSWQDWTLIAIRMLWVFGVILFMHLNQPAFPFAAVAGALLLCHFIPFLFARRRYAYYLFAECLLAGGLSLYLAFEQDLVRLFPPALFAIAFYSRGKAHWYAMPIAVLLFLSSAGSSIEASFSQPLIGQSLLDALVLYGISYGLQKGASAIQIIRNKLTAIKEQYTILEHHSLQMEKIAQLEERYRMARELHDSIGHTFTSLILGMETLKKHASSDEGEKKLNGLLGLAREGLNDIRRQVHHINPEEEHLSLEQSLLKLTSEYQSTTGIMVDFRSIGSPFPVMAHIKHALYRCLQETLTNAGRHGEASHVQVLMQYEPSHIRLQIRDNGRGNEQLLLGYGLTSLQQRLDQLQGNLYVHSQSDTGTIVACSIPNPAKERDKPLNILLADDQPLIRESLRLLLDEEKDFEVSAVADGRQAVAACEKQRPDLVLMDIKMPEMDGLAATGAIKSQWPDVKIIMITTLDDVMHVSEALRLGAEGYVLKSAQPKELAATIRLVASGGIMIAPEVAQQLFQAKADNHTNNPYDLTEREAEVLSSLTQGMRNKEIAQKLHLSEGTVRNYISSIYLKLSVNSRDEAVEKARIERLA